MTIHEFWESDAAGIDVDMQDIRGLIQDFERVLKEMKTAAVEANDDNLMYFYHRFHGVPEEELY